MKYLIVFCICTCTFIAVSQTLTLEENFDNNSMGWSIGKTANYDNKIEGGIFAVNYHPEKDVSQYYWRDYYINEKEDFIIESRMRFVSGTDNNGFGLTWGTDTHKNSQNFVISGNQFYKSGYYVDGNYNVNMKWTERKDLIKPKGEFNILKIHKQGDSVSLIINNEKVFVMPHRAFSGRNVGFYVLDKMVVEFDYLHVYHHSDINLIDNPINGYEKENLGPNINTIYSEIQPVISASGNTLMIVRKNSPENIGGEKDDIYYSKKLPDGSWSKAESFPRPINNEGHNSVISISADENTLILMNTYKPDGSVLGSGISISNRTETGWEVPVKIEIDDYYNDGRYSSFCMSSSKNVLLMSIERKDTRGGNDLYVSFEKDGKFTAPVNMGDVLNTSSTDVTPFLAADDRTLYFSTAGHPGYGSNDIFMSRRLDDTWLNWSTPLNLGPEINSGNWDAYFTLPAKGDFAYLVSYENAIGKTDLFRIKLPEAAKPTPVILVRGRVLNSKTKEPLSAEIIYENPATGKAVGSAISDPNTGEYTIVLAGGSVYGFLADKKEFYAVSDYLDLTQTKMYDEVTRDLLLSPIEKGESIRLNNVFFDTDKSVLREESTAELQRLIRFLKANPDINIQLEGHTDAQGNADYNLRLSNDRAKAVLTYLLENGIDASRLNSKGFGKNNPVATNDTPEGRQLNRRVEFRID